MPKCPSAKRPFAAGPHGATSRNKLSTYGQLMREKQKLRAHYALTETQLRFIYKRSQVGTGQVGEKLLRNLEMRLASVVFRSGLAPTIFAAKQAVVHGHVCVDGKKVDRNAYRVKPGQVISVNPEKSPAIAAIAQAASNLIPPYLEVDKPNCKVTVTREPLGEEIPSGVNIMSVVEFYAR
jgi:small subunit ribosomal protein S4